MDHSIKSLLHAKGIILSALADELGVRQSTMSLVAAGKSKSYPIQQAIAQKLDSTIADLWPSQIRLRRNRAEIEAAHAAHISERRRM
ncbi:MAG: helix-turn-helix domain-containing protein [Azoarcus sp.]|jgi:lambda repressor-like predicted transcriptional regulator|nr:helix-turn-helix domain-containing protein [Azoarcus sp.]